MRNLIIAAVIVITALAVWRIAATRVDMSKPEAVAAAFLKNLKANNVDKAGKYWVPDGADAWRTAAAGRIESMQSGTFTRFFEDLPASDATFTSSRKAGAAANEQTLSSGNFTVDMRQIDGKWYVSKGPP
jgi:hypothetical protein